MQGLEKPRLSVRGDSIQTAFYAILRVVTFLFCYICFDIALTYKKTHPRIAKTRFKLSRPAHESVPHVANSCSTPHQASHSDVKTHRFRWVVKLGAFSEIGV
jgi:hypothetical protein